MDDDTSRRAWLAAKRAELEAELAELSAPPGDSGGISFGKRVGEGTAMAAERLSQVAAHGRLQAMLTEVVRAEQKLDDGTDGVCDGCGAAIGSARVDALPWATRCLACAAARPA